MCVSVNRGSYVTVLSSAISGENYKTDKLIGGNCPPIRGQYAFNGTSPGFGGGSFATSTAALGTFNAGDIVSVQFLGSAHARHHDLASGEPAGHGCGRHEQRDSARHRVRSEILPAKKVA